MRRNPFRRLGTFAFVLLALGLTAAAAVSTVGGVTFGDWNLPSGGSNGFATGVLNDSGGNTVFKMKAELKETVSPSFAVRVGTIKGELDDGDPALFPLFTVSGNWTSNLAGQGTFQASINKQVSPLGPVVQIGKMAGKFSDPPSKIGDPVGKYKGEWKAQL